MNSPFDSTSPKEVPVPCPGAKRAISVSGHINAAAGAIGFVALTRTAIPNSQAANVRADEVGGGTAANWSIQGKVLCADVQ